MCQIVREASEPRSAAKMAQHARERKEVHGNNEARVYVTGELTARAAQLIGEEMRFG